MLKLAEHVPILHVLRLCARSQRGEKVQHLRQRKPRRPNVVLVGDLHPNQPPQQSGARQDIRDLLALQPERGQVGLELLVVLLRLLAFALPALPSRESVLGEGEGGTCREGW